MPHINVFGGGIDHEVWLDPSDNRGDMAQGLCLGEGATREVAIREALEETQRISRQLEELLRQPLQRKEGHQ